jgi:hypothetical protein
MRIKTRLSTPTVKTVADNEQPGSTALPTETVHSAEECAPNGDGMPIVQAEELQDPPVQDKDGERLMIKGV